MFEWKEASSSIYFVAITRHGILPSFSGMKIFLNGKSAVTIGTLFFLVLFFKSVSL